MKHLLLLLLFLPCGLSAQEIVVGSKAFNEGVILGEILAQTAREAGAKATHKSGMGGTGVVWGAFKGGDIDAYVEYTGTLKNEIYATEAPADIAAVERLLERDGFSILATLGFNNTYAIGLPEELAEALNIRTISDLAKHPQLRLGFSNEFKDRSDGWTGLRDAYALPHEDITWLEHSLAYEAMNSRTIDVTDLYSTDAEIEQYNLRVLKDDRAFFPEYKGVIVARFEFTQRAPRVAEALRALDGKIQEASMIAMNAAVMVDKQKEQDVAVSFVQRLTEASKTGESVDAADIRKVGERSLGDRIDDALTDLPGLTSQHIALVFSSLFAGVLVAVPLGVLARRRRRIGQVILGGAGVLQTIPSIALLVLLIPLFGIGWLPAVIALFLYSLLPIVRNTHTGLSDIDPMLLESADALGLTKFARLNLVELPLSARSIVSGIKIAAVINVGTATLGGFIGAGGYGELILAGIRRQDNVQILAGAIPAALMALLIQGLFELFERAVVPKGLRLSAD